MSKQLDKPTTIIPSLTLVFKTSLQSYHDAITALAARHVKLKKDKVEGMVEYVYIGDVYKQLNREFQKELVTPLGDGFQIPLNVESYFKKQGITLELVQPALLSIKVINGSELRIFLSKE